MKRLYAGKTKDVYEQEDGNLLLLFKDDVTGADGVFDPGANTVGLTIDGAGEAGLRLTKHFFELLKEKGIPTHYIEANPSEKKLVVIPATVFGEGLEVICRYRAVGSFLKRYGKYAKEGQKLDAFVEVTLKDDDRNDPPIGEQALAMLGVLTKEEYVVLTNLTREICGIVKDELATRDIDLYDIKLEFGRNAKTGEIILIDEISGGNMRTYKDGAYVDPLVLTDLVLN